MMAIDLLGQIWIIAKLGSDKVLKTASCRREGEREDNGVGDINY